jgi:hypothetical protein
MLHCYFSCRSADLETKGDVSLPSYRGDIINGPEFTPEARIPDPWRLVRAYNQSAATLNLLRGFSTGGYAGGHSTAAAAAGGEGELLGAAKVAVVIGRNGESSSHGQKRCTQS